MFRIIALSPISVGIGLDQTNNTHLFTFAAIFQKEEILNQFNKMEDDIENSLISQFIIGLSVVMALFIIVSL